MALCAYLNGAAFGHVSLPAHLVRPEDVEGIDRAGSRDDESGTTKTTKRNGDVEETARRDDVEAGFDGESSFRAIHGERGETAERRSRSNARFKTCGVLAAIARFATATLRSVDRALPFAESEEARRLRARRARDANHVADVGRRRDRVVSWMCDFRRLDKKRVSRDDRVVTIAAGFAVTDERFLDARKRREAVSAAEELLTLAVVLLAAPETFAARGGDALPRAALDAAARGVGAAVAGGDRYCASFAWRAVVVFEKALRSSVPSVRAAAASALARRDASGRNDFADACAALLFRRHDIGVPRPSFFNLRRWWDVALAEPEYRAANAAMETGLTRGKKLTRRGAARTSRRGASSRAQRLARLSNSTSAESKPAAPTDAATSVCTCS
jgi:hypothetical protein